ncbi:MAG: hypothetical protein PsegKO_16320 [Pseudohongiellaceae bacterium]
MRLLPYSVSSWVRRSFGKPRVVVVLGMPRSGMNFMAAALQQAGLDLQGSVPRTADSSSNDSPVMALNEAVLAESGGSWEQPPEQVEWSGAQLAAGKKLVADCGGSRVWGINDPRLLLTLDGWQDLLSAVQLVGVFRHPQAVAKSLQANCDIASAEQAMRLWLDYNQRLLARYRSTPFPILNFDPLLDNPDARVGKIARTLGLPRPRRVRCFDPALINHRPDKKGVLPADVQSLYASLQSVAFL